MKMKSKYRKNRRRYNGKRRNKKNRLVLAAILIVIFIVTVIVGSIFFGRYLKEKAEISEVNRQETDALFSDTAAVTEKESILCGTLPPSRICIDYYSLSAEHEILPEEGAGVSVILRDKDALLYYSSPVAQSLGGQAAENGLLGVSEIFAPLKEKNCYISACIVLSEHNGENDIATDAVHAFEQALMKEIASAEPNEILLCLTGDADAEKVKMLCDISVSYRASSENKVPLGVLLPYSFFSQPNANELCRTLAEHYELLAVDYTDVISSEEVSMKEAVHARIDTRQMYLSRYSMRVVLDSESASLAEARETLDEAALYSVQTLNRTLITRQTDKETDE